MGASSVLGKAAEVLDCPAFSLGVSKFLWLSLGASWERDLPHGNCIATHWWLFWGEDAEGEVKPLLLKGAQVLLVVILAQKRGGLHVSPRP